jgi:hypothetical protein
MKVVERIVVASAVGLDLVLGKAANGEPWVGTWAGEGEYRDPQAYSSTQYRERRPSTP